MDSLERLLLYRKKLILPRIYQVINWFMWITYFCAILFWLLWFMNMDL
mgnify:CR=1 FL=1